MDTVNANDAVKQAVSAVEAVHGVDDVASIAIHMERGLLGGVYVAAASGAPIGIYIDPDIHAQELIVVHELGHFVDHQGLGMARNHASQESASLQEWRDAVTATRTFQELQEILNRGTVRVVHDAVEMAAPVNIDDVTQDVRWTELWARAYVQYVALRSGNFVLNAQVDARLDSQRASPVGYTLWWEEADFQPVAAAMDGVFIMKGWRT